MLDLRPTCEHCNKDLPPSSTEAMICSYVCTYCQPCVEKILHNVCPNCGGGFTARPNWPKNNLRNNNGLDSHPASEQVVHRPIDTEAHAEFAATVNTIPAHNR